MPTGYTAKLHDGEQSFEEFATECLRAFGALVTLRDEPDAPIPDEFQPSDYNKRELISARHRLATAEAMTDDAAERSAQANYDTQMKAWQRSENERLARKARYEATLAEVEAWTPPTPDHEGVKTFMRDQLTQSIDFDCSSWPAPEPRTGQQYRDEEIARARRDIEHHEKSQAEEIARAKERTAWVRAARESLRGGAIHA
jgi:hypothetical protein